MSEDKVDRYEHDKAMMCMNHNNRRMFFAVIAVCVTFITIVIAYSFREKNWIDMTENIIRRYCVSAEVPDGTQQSRDP